MSTTTYAEVAEHVRTTIARYTQALDDGRTEDVVATFCADGGCDMPGLGTPEGHDELRKAYALWKPRQPQRHLVLNTVLTGWSGDEATATSDVVFLLKGKSGWAIQAVGRYHDQLRREKEGWRFRRRTATFVD